MGAVVHSLPTLDEAADLLVNCVCAELEAEGRPVCACSKTIGSPMVAVGCECGARGASGELWVNFSTMYAADPTTLQRGSFVYPCRKVATVAEFRITVTRCFPTLTERGDLPSPEDQAEAASTYHSDLQAVWRAVSCCVTESTRALFVNVENADPEGGLSALVVTVAVEVRTPPSPALPSSD